MIVAMKKVTLITLSREADRAVVSLGRLGVVHIEHQQPPRGAAISGLQDEIALVKNALTVLSQKISINKNKPVGQKEVQDWRIITKHIIDHDKRLQQLEDYAVTLRNNISAWEHWGDFDPADFKKLAEGGISLGLYQIPEKEIGKIPAHIIVKEIFSREGIAHCLLISREKIEVPFKELPLPKMGLKEMQQRLSHDTGVMEDMRRNLAGHICYFELLKKTLRELENKLEFQEAARGMADAGELAYLRGFIPIDSSLLIRNLAQDNHWGIVLEEPSDEDRVPTLLRNPRWVNLINPVFKLLAIIPGYRELDISPLFLIFLSLFFGMIIGDAGYGAVYILLTFWMQKKVGSKISDKRVFPLFYLFSSCAVFWGLITGTVFGQEWFLKAGFKPLLPVLNDTKYLQAFCFFLGAFHLTLGQAWQGIRKFPSLTALADAGWICVLWSAFFIAKTLILDDPYPGFVNRLIASGVILVIFFSSPQRNILKGVAQGLGTVALSLMNNFTDVVSYIRLFAVGLAGVAISDTVNTLAQEVGGKNILAYALIIFAGHTINIVLGPMSVLVHGVRLNVLEFSGHANLSWSGVAYKPLKE